MSLSKMTDRQIDIEILVVVVGHTVVGRIVHIVEHTERIEQQRLGEQFGQLVEQLW